MNVWSRFLYPTVLLGSKLPNEIIEITREKSNKSNFSHQFESGSPFMSVSEVLVTTTSDLSRCVLHHRHHFSTCSWLSLLCWSAGRPVKYFADLPVPPSVLPSWVIWRANIRLLLLRCPLKEQGPLAILPSAPGDGLWPWHLLWPTSSRRGHSRLYRFCSKKAFEMMERGAIQLVLQFKKMQMPNSHQVSV